MALTHTGYAARSPMRSGLADDSCEIGRSIGALVDTVSQITHCDLESD